MKNNQEKLINKLTQEDLQAFADIMGGLLDKQSAVLASKKDLEDTATSLKVELKDEIKKSEGRLIEYVDQGITAVTGAIDDVSDQVVELRTEVIAIKGELFKEVKYEAGK